MEKDNIKIILLSKLKYLIKEKFNFYFLKITHISQNN